MQSSGSGPHRRSGARSSLLSRLLRRLCSRLGFALVRALCGRLGSLLRNSLSGRPVRRLALLWLAWLGRLRLLDDVGLLGARLWLGRDWLLRLGGHLWLSLLGIAFLGLGLLCDRVIVAAARAMDMAFLAFEVGLELLARRLALRHAGLAEQKVHDLVLVKGRAELRSEHRLLLDQLEETLPLLALILRRGLGHEPAHLLLTDVNAVRSADLGQQQGAAHAALGALAIIVRFRLNLRERSLGIGFMARLVAELVHDVLEFGIEHGFGHSEVVPRSELVEQLALHVRACETVELLSELVPDQTLELVKIIKTKRLGELVVDRRLARRLYTLDGDREGRVLALESVDWVVAREGHI